MVAFLVSLSLLGGFLALLLWWARCQHHDAVPQCRAGHWRLYCPDCRRYSPGVTFGEAL